MKKKPRLSKHEIDFLLQDGIADLLVAKDMFWKTQVNTKIDEVIKSLTHLRKQLAESIVIK